MLLCVAHESKSSWSPSGKCKSTSTPHNKRQARRRKEFSHPPLPFFLACVLVSGITRGAGRRSAAHSGPGDYLSHEDLRAKPTSDRSKVDLRPSRRRPAAASLWHRVFRRADQAKKMRKPARYRQWSFDSGRPCHDRWRGVYCTNGRVTSLSLADMNLTQLSDPSTLVY
eukprot:COSAG02_NODE_4905_length_4848_cov_4.913245_2_plen_169_part_00